MRRFAVLLALGVPACGSSKPPPPAGEASATVKRYFSALARADGAAVCREVTAETREQAMAKANASSCAEAAGQGRALPAELRERFLHGTIGKPRVDGGVARIEFVADDMFAEKRHRVTIKLEAREGAWRISGLPWGFDDPPDEVATCALGAIQSWDAGDVDPTWKRKGRKAYAVFISRLCKRVYAEHAVADPFSDGELSPSEERKVSKLATEVVIEMRREGLLSAD